MDYEKKYKEALERARKLYEQGTITESLAYIFPELKESEDERIRKELMDFIDTNTIDSDERRNRWFSYLEKYKPISFTSLENTEVKMSLMKYISELNQDVVHLNATCSGFSEDEKWANEFLNWFKILKERVQFQPRQGWSEEDKNILQSILDEYKSMSIEKRNWLKSLKGRVQPKQGHIKVNK